MAQEMSEELVNVQALERFLRERVPEARSP